MKSGEIKNDQKVGEFKINFKFVPIAFSLVT